MFGRGFNITIRSSLRWGKWKLLTGKAANKVHGWAVPPTLLYNHAKSIFTKVPLPLEAYFNDVKRSKRDVENSTQISFDNIPVVLDDTTEAIGSTENVPEGSGSGDFGEESSGEEESPEQSLVSISSNTRKPLSSKRLKEAKNAMAGKLGLDINDYQVQLYDIPSDPTEKFEVSDKHPKIVAIMLSKLADYYDASAPVRYPRLSCKIGY